MDENRRALERLAEQLVVVIENILHGNRPEQDELQTWAAAQYAWVPTSRIEEDPLIEAVTDCLVDILSCDGASWDTTPAAFAEDLAQLKYVLRMSSSNRG